MYIIIIIIIITDLQRSDGAQSLTRRRRRRRRDSFKARCRSELRSWLCGGWVSWLQYPVNGCWSERLVINQAICSPAVARQFRWKIWPAREKVASVRPAGGYTGNCVLQCWELSLLRLSSLSSRHASAARASDPPSPGLLTWLKGNQSENMSRPENIKNVRNFHL